MTAFLMTEENRDGQDVTTLGRLTPRQQEILQLLAKGFYYKEIGSALGISHSTVRAHLHSVYRKLEVKSRSRAVIKFHELVQQHQN
jgi:RNA polymerase sigma factor (sigma-70 family)